MSNINRLVYSTDGGRIQADENGHIQAKERHAARASGNGIVRLQRQTKGRNGKCVCLITGLDLDHTASQLLSSELKKKCGSGGAVKGSVIEIQGDKRDMLKQLLEARGLKVKLAGN